jgi:hypothetical protein
MIKQIDQTLPRLISGNRGWLCFRFENGILLNTLPTFTSGSI